jgi:hypothetical protein
VKIAERRSAAYVGGMIRSAIDGAKDITFGHSNRTERSRVHPSGRNYDSARFGNRIASVTLAWPSSGRQPAPVFVE